MLPDSRRYSRAVHSFHGPGSFWQGIGAGNTRSRPRSPESRRSSYRTQPRPTASHLPTTNKRPLSNPPGRSHRPNHHCRCQAGKQALWRGPVGPVRSHLGRRPTRSYRRPLLALRSRLRIRGMAAPSRSLRDRSGSHSPHPRLRHVPRLRLLHSLELHPRRPPESSLRRQAAS